MTEYLADETAGLDSAIAQVDTLYHSLTGQKLSATGPRVPIPPGRNPQRFVRDEVDRLVQLLDALASEPSYPPFVPVMESQETADELVLRVELPGVPRSAVSVVFGNTVLEVSGDRPMSENDELGEPFVRLVPLPANALEDEARATFKDGVLEVRIPLDDSEAKPLPTVDLARLQLLYDHVQRTIEVIEDIRARAYAGLSPATPPKYGFGAGLGGITVANHQNPIQAMLPKVAGLAALGLPLAMPLLRPDLQWLAQGVLPLPWRS